MTFTIDQILPYLPKSISPAWLYGFLAPAANGTRPGIKGSKNTYSAGGIDAAAQLRRKLLKKSRSRNAISRLPELDKRVKLIQEALEKVKNNALHA